MWNQNGHFFWECFAASWKASIETLMEEIEQIVKENELYENRAVSKLMALFRSPIYQDSDTREKTKDFLMEKTSKRKKSI